MAAAAMRLKLISSVLTRVINDRPKAEQELQQSLQLAPDMRSEDDVKRIVHLITKMRMAKKLTDSQQLQIARHLRWTPYSHGSLICRPGEVATKCFIVYLGECYSFRYRGDGQQLRENAHYSGEILMEDEFTRGLKCNIGLEAGGGLVMLELTSSPVLLLLQQIAKENGEMEHDTSEDKAWRHPINAIDSDDEEYDPDPHTCLDPKRYLSPLKCLRGFPCLTQWRIMNLAIRRTFASGTVLIHEGRPSPVVFMTLSGDCVVRKNVLTDEDKAKPASSVLADESLQVAIVSPSQFLGLTPTLYGQPSEFSVVTATAVTAFTIDALSLSRCVPIGGVFALLREDQLVNNWRREQWQSRRAQLGLTLLKLREHVCEVAGVLEVAEPTATVSPKRPVLTHGKPISAPTAVSPSREVFGDPAGSAPTSKVGAGKGFSFGNVAMTALAATRPASPPAGDLIAEASTSGATVVRLQPDSAIEKWWSERVAAQASSKSQAATRASSEAFHAKSGVTGSRPSSPPAQYTDKPAVSTLLAKGVMGKTWAKLQQAVSSETLFGAQDTKPAAPAGKADPLAEFEVPLPSLPVDSKWKPSWDPLAASKAQYLHEMGLAGKNPE